MPHPRAARIGGVAQAVAVLRAVAVLPPVDRVARAVEHLEAKVLQVAQVREANRASAAGLAPEGPTREVPVVELAAVASLGARPDAAAPLLAILPVAGHLRQPRVHRVEGAFLEGRRPAAREAGASPAVGEMASLQGLAARGAFPADEPPAAEACQVVAGACLLESSAAADWRLLLAAHCRRPVAFQAASPGESYLEDHLEPALVARDFSPLRRHPIWPARRGGHPNGCHDAHPASCPRPCLHSLCLPLVARSAFPEPP